MKAWICQTPTRFLVVVLSALLGLGVATIILTDPGRQPVKPKPPTVQPIDQGDAEEFAKAWIDSWCALNGRTPQQWHEDMARTTTVDYGNLLATTDTANLTGDCSYGAATTYTTLPAKVVVAVPLAAPRRLLVTVVRRDGRLVTADLQHDESDL